MAKHPRLARLVAHVHDCSACRVRPLCLPEGLPGDDLAVLSRIVKPGLRLRPAGDLIFRQGDRLGALYLIKTGSAKTYITSSDGLEQVVGFHFAGDLLGADAFANRIHASAAAALESTSLCEISYATLEQEAQQHRSILDRLLTEMGKELRYDHDMRLILSQRAAETRLASFLNTLSRRMERRGFSRTDLTLTMSRYDIANYLGVAPETVSRTLTAFERDGIVAVDRRQVRILDRAGLRKAAGEDDPSRPTAS